MIPLDVTGQGEVSLPTRYATRIFLVDTDRAALPTIADPGMFFIDDFTFGLNPQWDAPGHGAGAVVPDTRNEKNAVYRIVLPAPVPSNVDTQQ